MSKENMEIWVDEEKFDAVLKNLLKCPPLPMKKLVEKRQGMKKLYWLFWVPLKEAKGYVSRIAIGSTYRQEFPVESLKKCSEKGCVFPSAENGLCVHHGKFFEFSESLTDDSLDIKEYVDFDETFASLSTVSRKEIFGDIEKSIRHARKR